MVMMVMMTVATTTTAMIKMTMTIMMVMIAVVVIMMTIMMVLVILMMKILVLLLTTVMIRDKNDEFNCDEYTIKNDSWPPPPKKAREIYICTIFIRFWNFCDSVSQLHHSYMIHVLQGMKAIKTKQNIAKQKRERERTLQKKLMNLEL